MNEPRKASTKQQLQDALHADKLIARKDGTFEARDIYFYRHGRTVETFAAQVKAAARAIGQAADIIEVQDRFAPWPRDSYFAVRFRLAPPTPHDQDENCDVDSATGCCRFCGVEHGVPCPTCGGRGYHRPGCSEVPA